jgi:hypothetical protein
MHDDSGNKNHRNTIKKALAVGLTVVFIAVVLVQVKTYSAGEGAVAGDVRAGAKAPAQEPRSRSGASKPFGESRLDRADDKQRVAPWPEVELADCTAYDPFAMPEGFLATQSDAVQETVAEEARKRELELAQEEAARRQAISKLAQTGVNAVFQGPGQIMAVLGGSEVQVGQEIHGYRVVSIDPDGVLLEPIAAR